MKLNKGLKQSGLRVRPEMLARGSRWAFGLLWALPVLVSMAFGSPVYATPTISLTMPATPVEIDFFDVGSAILGLQEEYYYPTCCHYG